MKSPSEINREVSDLNADDEKKQNHAALLKKRHSPELSDKRYNLTIGTKPEFIWYRNAKVGTRSLLHLLDEAGAEFAVREAFQWYYPISHYQNHFKFAFVRNPWDRLVSAWRNKIFRKNTLGLDPELHEHLSRFNSFIEYISENHHLYLNNVHFKQQVNLIDLEHVDFIGRFEHFERDIHVIMDTLGLQVKQIPWRNKSKDRRPFQEFYTDRTRDIVSRMYREDIEKLSYQFDSSEGSHLQHD